MSGRATHRLDGLEPDNLLAFMALLGLLRVLEEARPAWRPRAFWMIDPPPVQPAIRLAESVLQDGVIQAACEGLNDLAKLHEFDKLSDLTELSPEQATERLCEATKSDHRYKADLWAALISDAAIARDGKKVEPTPLRLMSGRQRFLSILTKVLEKKTPPARVIDGKRTDISETDCLREALFAAWERRDATTLSFRWDPHEDVRHARRARAPTDDKEATQHGANRLAAIGLSALTVVPQRRAGKISLAILGGDREPNGGFTFGWPIWREPLSLAGIRALLDHPRLDQKTRAALGVVERRGARRVGNDYYKNFTRAEARSE